MAILSKNRAEKVFEALLNLYHRINGLHEIISRDHRKKQYLEQFSEYKRKLPGSLLEKTAEIIDSRNGKICFIGLNDCGRSTLLNSFLSRPLLAPERDSSEKSADIIIKVRPKGYARDERMEIVYYTYAEIVQKVLSKEYFKTHLNPYEEQLAKDPAYLPGALSEILENAEKENKEVPGELSELAEALSQFSIKLGNIEVENLDKRIQFLKESEDTTNESLIVKELVFFIENPLLKENRLEIIELPPYSGEDSWFNANEEYLADAEALIVCGNISHPQEFPFRDKSPDVVPDWIRESLKKNAFFVFNGVEQLEGDQLTRKFLEELYEKVEGSAAGWEAGSERIFLASSLRVKLAGLMNLPDKTEQDASKFEEIVRVFQEKKAGLDEEIRLDLLNKLRLVFGDGGISNLRNRVLNHVSRDMVLERCKAARQTLFSVLEILNDLMDPDNFLKFGRILLGFVRQVHKAGQLDS